ncbi:unnamed protein product [Vicia faba]|uniref:Uncharacterized protein n=1 Tax=Vicia faba TaxID=3906 RepID=A0AAV0Z261_VICFA|nr:unnamed protein product [Vicia faba]
MVSYTSTNSNNSDKLVKPMSSSSQPPSGRYVDHHQDPLEDLRKSFSKKQMGRPLGSKNKPKTCIVIEEDTQNIIEWVGLDIPIREDIVVNIIKHDQQLQHNIIVSGVSVLSLTNNSDTLVKPMSSSSQPPSGRYVDHHQDPLEDLRKSFSKKQMGRPLGSKNKPKACIVIEEDTQNFIEWVGLEIPIREDIVVNIIKHDQQLQHNIIVSGVSVLSLTLPFLI